MKSLNFARYAFITVAVGLFATSSDAAWTYTETNTVVNDVSKGSITDGVWTFYAERAKNSKNLSVKANQGSSTATEPCVIDFTTIGGDGIDGVEGEYKVVSFYQFSSYHGEYQNATKGSMLYSKRGLVSKFIAPCCTQISGEGCFYGCTNLIEVSLGESVKIGSGRVFENCTSLKTLVPGKFNNQTTSTAIFKNCLLLEGELEFSECTSFGSDMFNSCAKLGGIKAENANTVGQSSFQGCSSLSNIVLSSSVEYIGNYAFKGCSKITTEFVQGILHKGLKRLGNEATNRHGCFQDCTGLTGSLVWNLPNLITNAVPNVCFSGCTSLERVEIKSPVSVIGPNAFFNLKKGAEVYLPNEPISVYESHAVATVDAPFPRVYIGGDINSQLAKMYAFNNNLIKKEEFNDTTWKSVLPNQSSVTWNRIVNDKMLKDETMCSIVDGKVVVKDKNVVAFIMGNTNNGCWILKKPEIGFKVIVR